MKIHPRALLSRLVVVAVAAAQSATAAVTVQGWWHYGEVTDFYADSSGNNRRFNSGFSCAGSGNAGAGIVPIGVGGPLGTTGFISTNALYWTPLHCSAAAMWNPWGTGGPEWNPPPTNYVIECWILPEDIASSPGRTWFFASGSGDFSQPTRPARTGAGGVYFVWDKTAGTGGAPAVGAFVIANASQGVPSEVQIGNYVDSDYTKWMHVAVVNTDGTNTFYVNGVQAGASTSVNTIPNGNIFAGGSPGTTPSFHGWMDELRISTFASGQFSTADLLLRPAGPSIITQPQSATVWNGGAAPFTVVAALDPALTYQWQREGTNLPAANSATLYLPQVSLADSGAQFRCILTASSISVTSSVVTLTVLPNRTADVDFYRAAVTAGPGLAAFFPADDCLGTTLTNVVDLSRNGQLEGIVTYDGRTNRAFGQRAVSFNAGGDVQIPNNPAFEFSGGNGTVEAIIYMDGTAFQDETIFAWAYDFSTIGYALQASADGSQLIYLNDSPITLTWPAPVSLIGRRAHVALVIDNTTNVTAILDGQSLGTKVQPGFGAAGGAPVWIGALGTSLVKPFKGTIDELSVYGTNLSVNTIQVHYSRFLYGTNVSAPSIVSQPGSRSVLAHSAPILGVQVAGTLPIAYQWSSNGVAIPGANSTTLTVKGGVAATTATYVLWATNAIGWTNTQPIVLTFTAASGAYANAVLADSPSSFWRLGESSGPLAVDSSGYNDATYTGSFTYGVPGAITTDPNTAVQFDNSTAPAPYSSTLNPATAFTLECYVKPTVNGQSSRAIVGSQNRNIGRSGYALYQGFNGNFWECHIGNGTTVTMFLQGTTPIEAGKWYHLAVVYDPNDAAANGRLYVNGVQESSGIGGFLPNNAQPFTIGGRQGLGNYTGIIDELAFYNYALTANQISNHWSYSWIAPAITQHPANVTSNEWSTIALTVVASGYPNKYQWYKVGSGALADADNFDLTRHYPNGVTNATLTITQSKPADSGQYYVVVFNDLGSVQSSNATVVINPDAAKPKITSVVALGTPNAPPNPAGGSPYLVKVLFDERIDPNFPGTYTIPGVTVNSTTLVGDARAVVLGGDWREAIVYTAGLTPGQTYTLNVSGARDQAQTQNTMDPASITFRAPLLSKGSLVWDYYYLGATTGSGIVSDLTGNPNYPNVPMTNWSSSTFDTTPITGGDINNKAPYGALGDYYGCSLSGWITPTVTTNYHFFIASDDASELQLSPDSNPANATVIAQASQNTAAFAEPGAENTSGLQALTAGVPYFIRALQVEGGGGDWVKVAWRMQGDSTPAANLTPIPSQYLSSYAPGPIAFNPISFAGGQLTLSWTGTGTLLQSTNVALPLNQWTPVPGNPTSPYTVTPANGEPQMFYRLSQ